MPHIHPDAGIEPGTLLVAAPSLHDENFSRSVVYVLDHQPQGTVGVVLNRPGEVNLFDVLPQWWELASAPRTLFMGGPVDPNSAICLAEVSSDDHGLGWRTAGASVLIADLATDPREVQDKVSQLRVFAGYAGWKSGQLRAEIGDGAWFVFAGRSQDVFASPEVDLWRSVLRRQGGRIAMLATYPSDPRLN